MPSIINATLTNGLVTSADNSGSLQLQTNNGTTAVTIDTSQNVGIGTSSPGALLDVSTSADSFARVRSTGSIQSAVLTLTGRNASADETWNIISTGAGLGSRALRFTYGGWTGSPSLAIDGSANLQFNSGYGSVATAYGCRAWVNFNGTGTVAIRASGNVSSITDNGTGEYRVNLTNAMPDANYSIAVSTGYAVGNSGSMICPINTDPGSTPTTSTFVVTARNSVNAVALDPNYFFAAIFR